MNHEHRSITRRHFLRRTAGGTGLLALGGAALAAGQQPARAAAQGQANPFAYDIERLTRTDPAFIRYETAGQCLSPQPEPRRLAVGPQDRVYIAGQNGVSILDRTGARRADVALDAPARCVAVQPDGTIYVGLREHVAVFNARGQRQTIWAAPAPKAWLTGLAVGEGGVFAADAGNRLVWHYDLTGKLLGRLGEKDKARKIPGLVVPSPYLDVALGRDGRLRVNNPGRHCVEVYTPAGDLERSWGKPSMGLQGFCGCCNPVAVTLLPDGRYVTCEKGLPRVKVYNTDGAFECVVAGPESFPENTKAGALRGASDGLVGGLDAAVDSQGRIWVLDLVAANLRVLRPKA
jgi:hypothetical protein